MLYCFVILCKVSQKILCLSCTKEIALLEIEIKNTIEEIIKKYNIVLY